MAAVKEIFDAIELKFGVKVGLPGRGTRLTAADWESVAKKFSDAEMVVLSDFFASSDGKDALQRFEMNLKNPSKDSVLKTPYDRRGEFFKETDIIFKDINGWILPASVVINSLSEKEFESLAESLFGEFTVEDAKLQTDLAIRHSAEIRQQLADTEKTRESFQTDLFVSGTPAAKKLLAEVLKHPEEWVRSDIGCSLETLIKREAELDSMRPLLQAAGIGSLEQLKAINELISSSMTTTKGRMTEIFMSEVRVYRFNLRKYLSDPAEVGREVQRRKALELAGKAREAETLLERAKSQAASLGKLATSALKAITK
jgi:hypothetical protein